MVVSKLPTKQRISPKQLAPSRSSVRFAWRLNDTQLPSNIYSRGQLLVHHPPTGATTSAASPSSRPASNGPYATNADPYSQFASNYGISESRNDDQNNKYHQYPNHLNQQGHQNQYPNHLGGRKTGKLEPAWSKAKYKRSDLVAGHSLASKATEYSNEHSKSDDSKSDSKPNEHSKPGGSVDSMAVDSVPVNSSRPNSPNAHRSSVDMKEVIAVQETVNRNYSERKGEIRRSDVDRNVKRTVEGNVEGNVERTTEPTTELSSERTTERNEAHSTDQHSETNVNKGKQRVKRTGDVHSSGSGLNTRYPTRSNLEQPEFELDNLRNQSAFYHPIDNHEERPINDFAPPPNKQLRSTNPFNKDKKHYPNYYYMDHSANFDQDDHQPDMHASNHLKNASDLYVSKLNLDTKIYSFGFVECWAENEIGVQEEPCVFQVIPAGGHL